MERQQNSGRLLQPCTSVLSFDTMEADNIISLGAHEDYMVPSFLVAPAIMIIAAIIYLSFLKLSAEFCLGIERNKKSFSNYKITWF